MMIALEHPAIRTEIEAAPIENHLEALGLISTSAYKLWCRRNGFSMSLDKTAAGRDEELRVLRQQNRPKDSRADKNHDPQRAELIRRIAMGECEGEWLPEVGYSVRNLFRAVKDVDGGHAALLDLLLHLEAQGSLLLYNAGLKVTSRGLPQLIRHHAEWVREPTDWRALSSKPWQEFRDLASHLLARYQVPQCLNKAWFETNPAEAAVQQEWYKHIGTGQNIRRAANLPFRLTKRAAHDFMTSDSGYDPLMSLRLSQISALSGESISKRLPWTLAANERLHSRENADFWTSVITFIINNPMMEISYVNALVDYIHHKKFEHRPVPQPDGSTRLAPPEHPLFSVKGRSMAKLVREVDEWHEQLSADVHDTVQEWESSGIGTFELTEDNKKLETRIHWSIHELRSSAQLQVEGRIMHHCVASYAKRCVAGETSVWSLRSLEDDEEAEPRHVLTMAVDNRKRLVGEARGKFNMQPHGKMSSNKQRRRTDSTYRVALRESARILALWRRAEGLGYSQD